MSPAALHRRLVIGMSVLALCAFAAGAGVEPISAGLGFAGLGLALFWTPGPVLARRLSRVWPPLAIILTVNIAIWVVQGGRDMVVPVVGLLLLLMVSEALRPEDSLNEARLYALSLALLLASTAYRPGALFALAFGGYVFLAALAVPLGILRRKAERFGGDPPSPDRRFVFGAVGIATVTLVSAAAVFLVFPRATQGWSGRGDLMATSIAGFSDRVSIGDVGSSIYSNPRVVLRVEFPEGLPGNFLGLHWRGRSYDHFDGTRWTRSDEIRPSRVPDDWYSERWPGDPVRQDIYAAPLDVRVLFGIGPVVAVRPESDIYPMFDNVGDWSYWGSGIPVYTAFSQAEPPPAELLRRAERGYMPDRQRYLQLPRLPDRIAALADSVVEAAGAETRYDQAAALERFLRSRFGYTRELPATAGEATLDHFLFERREGHCEYFSTAMVVMLRSLGVHARNVNGFLGGRWNEFGRYLAVTQNEAHSWVEVWFPGYGWVTFDPTPGGASGAGDESGWLWPGRFWLDGLQHRWNKWILDYSLDLQILALDRFLGFLDPEAESGSAGGTDAGDPSSWTWILAGAVLAALAVLWRRIPARTSPRGVSRGYLTLVRTARRRGLLGPGPVTPFRFVREVGRHRPDAASAASRAIDLYTRARFGGRPLSAEELRNFRAAVREARRGIS